MKAADVTDTVLEAAVVPSFSRIGPLLRSRLDHWTSTDTYRLDGRVIVITGATSGLGLVAAHAWLAAGATVEIVARNPQKSALTVARLQEEIEGASVTATIGETAARDRLIGLAREHAETDGLVPMPYVTRLTQTCRA